MTDAKAPRPRPATAPLPDALTLARQVACGERSARQTVEAALARIAALNDSLGAFCTLAAEAALRRADGIDAQLARGERLGPLAGVPIAVKDLIATAGIRTTFGSPLYHDFLPDEDEVVVQRLQDAGAIVIGKTNASEFGYGPVGHNAVFPPTRNPWNTEMTPGGSSAGSAVAVATGMVPIALGSDGGGSIRIPAALTGVFGIKPSWGRVPLWPGCRDERYPGASSWETLEHIGPLTRTVADAALALAALSGPSPLDRHSLPLEPLAWSNLDPSSLRGIRIAYGAGMGTPVDPEIAALCEGAARDLAEALGATLSFAAPETGPIDATFATIVAMETDRTGLRRMGLDHNHSFPPQLADLLEAQWTADDFTAAIMARKRIANAAARFMGCHDLLLTPTVAAPAFALGMEGPATIDGCRVAPTTWTCFSALANLTGQPAASIPVGLTAQGLPVGLQVIGAHLDDIGVLRAAALMERIRP